MHNGRGRRKEKKLGKCKKKKRIEEKLENRKKKAVQRGYVEVSSRAKDGTNERKFHIS